jgi:hypothetical protein
MTSYYYTEKVLAAVKDQQQYCTALRYSGKVALEEGDKTVLENKLRQLDKTVVMLQELVQKGVAYATEAYLYNNNLSYYARGDNEVPEYVIWEDLLNK